MLSKVFLIGRITAKPTLSMLSNSNRVMTKFSLAVNKNNGSGHADFWNITAFDKTAELVVNYLSKGSLIYLEGILQQNNYTNSEGKKSFSINIIANNVIFLDNKSSNLSNGVQAAKNSDILANEMLQNFQTQIPVNNSELSFSNKTSAKENSSEEIEEDIQWEKKQ